MAILKISAFLSLPYWFFCFIPMKRSQSLLVSKGWSKFWSSQTWQHFLNQTKYFVPKSSIFYCVVCNLLSTCHMQVFIDIITSDKPVKHIVNHHLWIWFFICFHESWALNIESFGCHLWNLFQKGQHFLSWVVNWVMWPSFFFKSFRRKL